MGQQYFTKTAAKAQVNRKMPYEMDETPYMPMECMCAHILWKLSIDDRIILKSNESFSIYAPVLCETRISRLIERRHYSPAFMIYILEVNTYGVCKWKR